MTDSKKSAADWLAHARALPSDPGVYLFKDDRDQVIYVGKAKNLGARVTQYFAPGTSDIRAFIGHLEWELADIDTHVTRSEKEALILERELIAKHEPKYNVVWRDDKQFLCLRVDPSHDYPWVQVVRQMGRDGARYFGPFHSASAARKTLRVVNRHFQLRTCRDSVLYNRSRPCLEYQIGRCPAPCVFDIDREAYMANVDDALMFLEGKGQSLVNRLEKRMWEASEAMEFEVAARTRDQIKAINKTLERQHAALATMRDQDVLGLFRKDGALSVAVLEVRDGRVRDVRARLFEAHAFDDASMLESFLLQFYSTRSDVPSEVIVPLQLESEAALSEILSEKRGKRVLVKFPQRGERVRVLELARDNAEHSFYENRRKTGAMRSTLEGLKDKLRLTRVPYRIECFDISNLQGKNVVGSRVSFRAGLPDKKGYRRYRVKTTLGQDDFGAMYEVLSRRLSRGMADNDLPDLIVVDGGKGQLASAKAAMTDLGLERGPDMVGLAKSRVVGRDGRDATSRSPERVFVLGAKDPIVMSQHSPEVRLLAQVRDEAHRFAITFHKSLRRRATLRSELRDIPGVGPKRQRALLKNLGSLKRVKLASIEELAAVPGMGPAAAERVWAYFHPPLGATATKPNRDPAPESPEDA